VRDDSETSLDEVSTGVDLGAGLIEEEIFRQILDWPENASHREALQESMAHPIQRVIIFLECRKAKEDCFINGIADRVIRLQVNNRILRGCVSLDAERMNQILDTPLSKLGGKSWRNALRSTLARLVSELDKKGMSPKVVIMTGGASRMAFFREEVENAFPNASVKSGTEPELFVARGLARWGRRRRHMEEFRCGAKRILKEHNYVNNLDTRVEFSREALKILHESQIVKKGLLDGIVESRFPVYIDGLAQSMAQPLVDDVLIGHLKSWRWGFIDTLRETGERMQRDCESWMKGEGAAKVRREYTAKWRSTIEDDLVEILKGICRRCGINSSDLAANLQDVPAMSVDGKGMLGSDDPLDLVPNLNGVFSTIIGVIVGTLALIFIATGPLGWIIGATVGVAGGALSWVLGGDIIPNTKLPVKVREWTLTDAKIEEARLTLKSDIQQKIASELRKDPTLVAKLRETLKAQVEGRIDQAVNRALLLFR
jgi:hypothetical protein